MTSIEEFLENPPPEPEPRQQPTEGVRTFRLRVVNADDECTELFKEADADMVETSMFWNYGCKGADEVGEIYEFTIRKVHHV